VANPRPAFLRVGQSRVLSHTPPDGVGKGKEVSLPVIERLVTSYSFQAPLRAKTRTFVPRRANRPFAFSGALVFLPFISRALSGLFYHCTWAVGRKEASPFFLRKCSPPLATPPLSTSFGTSRGDSRPPPPFWVPE